MEKVIADAKALKSLVLCAAEKYGWTEDEAREVYEDLCYFAGPHYWYFECGWEVVAA